MSDVNVAAAYLSFCTYPPECVEGFFSEIGRPPFLESSARYGPFVVSVCVRSKERAERGPIRQGDKRKSVRRRAASGSTPDARARHCPGSLRVSSGGAPATVSRVGGEAIRNITDRGSTEASSQASRRKLGAAVSAGLLGFGLLAARRPRLLAWPQATAGIAAGGLGLLRAAWRDPPEHETRDASDQLGD